MAGEHLPVLGGWCTPVPCGQQLLHPGPFQTFPYVLPSGLFICVLYNILYYKLVSISKCLLSSVNGSNKLTENEEDMMEPPVYSQAVRGTGDNLDLRLPSEVGAVWRV